MKVKVVEVSDALHPSEVVVAVKTLSGTENIVVDRRSIAASALVVGHPIRHVDNDYLIELPRESESGSWRVWVKEDQLIDEQERLQA